MVIIVAFIAGVLITGVVSAWSEEGQVLDKKAVPQIEVKEAPQEKEEAKREEPGMVFVPAGEFLMGRSEEEIRQAVKACQAEDTPEEVCRNRFEQGSQQHTVYVDAFWIDKTEATNAQYKAFWEEVGGRAPALWDDPKFSGPNQPLVDVSWVEAQDYCLWAGKRLPTEAEWEKAARGTDGRLYPWGNTIDSNKANYDNQVGKTKEVGSYPEGASPYGALDMAGNVWEWTSSLFRPYPYSKSDGREAPFPGGTEAEEMLGRGNRVLRGGAWDSPPGYLRSANRGGLPPFAGSSRIGFRCAK